MLLILNSFHLHPPEVVAFCLVLCRHSNRISMQINEYNNLNEEKSEHVFRR